MNGSATTVRGRRFRGWFSCNGTGTVLPREVVGRRHRDEDHELVDRPLSWGMVAMYEVELEEW